MHSQTESPEDYISKLPDERKEIVNKLRKVIIEKLPEGFAETMNYGMIGYVVPHSVYPKGYHVDPRQPLPFINIASQKNHIAFYHLGLYADNDLSEWFTSEYKNLMKMLPDMGKSCIRFKKPDQIPFKLIGELVSRMTVSDWIRIYEARAKR